jgi:protein-S-isoprenylcysteine O-methyltransferase Ste14
MDLLFLFTIFGLLGISLFIFCRLWLAFLKQLAMRHDIATRRKIASRWYIIVAVVFIGLMQGSIYLCVSNISKEHIISIPVFLLLMIGPAIIWWVRRMRELKELGYGSRKSETT